MRRFLLLLFLWNLILTGFAQQTVTFSAADGVTITADHYVVSTQNPYLILLHQAGYSRGEYRETAPKFANLGFNCLAVDLRSGGEVNFVKNQTAIDAISKGSPNGYLDAQADIIAAIDFVASRSKKPIVLVGSSYSASLALVIASHNFKVKAVVAFSPGEYFGSNMVVKSSTEKLMIPLFATSSRIEFPQVKQMLSHIPPKYITLLNPSQGAGVHGSKALWEANPNHGEYWMAITQFFSQLKLK
jgi:pimeloyl-ACP methyl ester carboxylesterase